MCVKRGEKIFGTQNKIFKNSKNNLTFLLFVYKIKLISYVLSRIGGGTRPYETLATADNGIVLHPAE
jgi:hypothetical protein